MSGDRRRVLLEEDARVLRVRSQCRRKRGAEGEGGCWGCSQDRPPVAWYPGLDGHEGRSSSAEGRGYRERGSRSRAEVY